MSRRSARELALHMAFEMHFTGENYRALMESRLTPEEFTEFAKEDRLYNVLPDERDREYIARLLGGVDAHMPELDGYIEKYSVGWKFERLSNIVIALLRIAMYEILYEQDTPNSVAINEAVELCKRYDTQEAAAFLNGILSSFVKEEVRE
ncbi:MAG: transcription antitermination factor NusB [Oscillospiraceae bacterium]|nr:transcription antitermination factor NusB [Oscillospiraceae bacterium]